jgi:hypothetical protein
MVLYDGQTDTCTYYTVVEQINISKIIYTYIFIYVTCVYIYIHDIWYTYMSLLADGRGNCWYCIFTIFWFREVAQIMCTHVSKCKNNKIKFKKQYSNQTLA